MSGRVKRWVPGRLGRSEALEACLFGTSALPAVKPLERSTTTTCSSIHFGGWDPSPSSRHNPGPRGLALVKVTQTPTIVEEQWGVFALLSVAAPSAPQRYLSHEARHVQRMARGDYPSTTAWLIRVLFGRLVGVGTNASAERGRP